MCNQEDCYVHSANLKKNVITNKDLKHLPKKSETEIIFLIKIGENRMIVEYIIAKECKNEEVWCTCYKCGKCGRVFENGLLIEEGGTTIEEDQDG